MKLMNRGRNPLNNVLSPPPFVCFVISHVGMRPKNNQSAVSVLTSSLKVKGDIYIRHAPILVALRFINWPI